MTIQANIAAASGYTNTTDIDACVDKAFRQISLRKGATTVEGDDDELDIIAEQLAEHYLDRMRYVRQHAADPNINTVSAIERDILRQVDAMMVIESPSTGFKLGSATPTKTIDED